MFETRYLLDMVINDYRDVLFDSLTEQARDCEITSMESDNRKWLFDEALMMIIREYEPEMRIPRREDQADHFDETLYVKK